MTDAPGRGLFTIAGWAVGLTLVAAPGALPPTAIAQVGEPLTATTTIVVPGPPDDVFALFAPGRRTDWDPEWEITITTPGQARPDGPGAVFHKPSQPETVWNVVAHDSDGRVLDLSYVRPDFYDMSVRIECSPEGDHTSVAVTYTAVAHTDPIHDALKSTLGHQIDTLVAGKDGWRDQLTHFLTHGSRFTPFEPVAIERRHVAEFDAPPDQVFALTNPESGNHWTVRTPEYVFGSADEPSGAMWRRRDSWFLVADHDPARRSMKTVLFIPETEFMIEELRCDPSPGGGTTMTVTWRVAGLPPDGNEAVQAFFDQSWDQRMAMLEESYRAVFRAETSSR